MAVNVGPLSAAYNGTVAFELDEENRCATVRARGQGKAGMGNADMKMTSRVVALGPGETEVTVDADLSVTGILAQLGRGMMPARQQEDVQGVHRGSGEGARFMIAKMSNHGLHNVMYALHAKHLSAASGAAASARCQAAPSKEVSP